MTILFDIALMIIIPGVILFAGVSVTHIKDASRKPCNGELKQLAHLDGTIKKFHKVLKQAEQPKGTMHHIHS